MTDSRKTGSVYVFVCVISKEFSWADDIPENSKRSDLSVVICALVLPQLRGTLNLILYHENHYRKKSWLNAYLFLRRSIETFVSECDCKTELRFYWTCSLMVQVNCTASADPSIAFNSNLFSGVCRTKTNQIKKLMKLATKYLRH